jgi:hypothetical protein
MLNEPDAIDRSLLLGQLISTERHISAAAQNVLRQQSIIDELERKGQDTTYARSILRRLQDMQAVRVAERDRMRASLKSC